MIKKVFIYTLIAMFFVACDKETSVEGDGSAKIAKGTLLDSAGNCKPIKVNGVYVKNIELNNTNNITINVNFTDAGGFTIYSDTVNGIWFRVKSFAFVSGLQTLGVQGYGKPIANIDAHFTLHFANSTCIFTVKKYTAVLVNGTNDDYFPTTNFSNWVYDNSLINDTSTVTVTGFDRKILGNNFRKFLLQIPKYGLSDTLFYRKDANGNYYKYDTIATGAKTEFQFLKDYSVVNDTFASPVVAGNYQGSPTDVRYFFTMLRKNVRRTINGNTIDSIIIMKQETQYLVAGSFTTTNTYEFSYAKKVGLVNVEQKNASNNLLAPVKKWVIN